VNEKISREEISLYLEAFKFNWDKIKHNETQRLQVLYFNIILIIALLSIIPHVEFPYLILLLAIVSISSFLFYLIILKLNAETSACHTTLQWISEKLGLIENMELEEIENLKTELKKAGVKEVPKYVFYKEAYVNISIPLHRRVHDVITYFSEFLTITSSSATIGTFLYFVLASLKMGMILCIVITCVLSLIFMYLIYFYLHRSILGKVKGESMAYKKARKPKEITIWKEGREKI
jgi:ABC-type transport system involved in cytochrome bd biosynthesis fused ATPase/permease subunit